MFKATERKQRFSKNPSAYTQAEQQSGLRYPHTLSFYDRPPLEDVTLEEFETCALDRLRVLAEIESSVARNRPWDELAGITEGQCRKYNLWLHTNAAQGVDKESERWRDHLGHFVLRLVFSESEELRQRFVKVETLLFRVRYEKDGHSDRNLFLESRNFQWIAVGNDEKEQYRAELLTVHPHLTTPHGAKGDKLTAERFYKVRWTRVPDLVERRKVFIKGGWAFVPESAQSSLVFQEFESRLKKALEMTAKELSNLDEDTRLVPILDNLSHGFLAGVPSEWNESPNGNETDIKAEMVDEIARKHFPLCMRHLHDSLRRDRHLKYFGRLQYGLFLKVLGLSIDEAVAFWRKSFSGMTDDKFNKEYKYNIRHSYGLEGKRANYSAKSCQQILLTNQPGPSDCHGCPYRHFSPENLQTALVSAHSSQGLTHADLSEIMSIVKAEHYHVACTRVFEITHAKHVKKGDGIGGGESVTHPNQYVAKSRDLEKGAAISIDLAPMVE